MPNISPGVYTKIIDLSAYVSEVPGTIGLICGLTIKGEDNKLKFYSSRMDLLNEMGEPNIADFGKNYGQGMYCAYNYLGESGALYFMRCMPDDASYANLLISADMGAADATASITTSYIGKTDANSKAELRTQLEAAGDSNPVCVLYPIGRGEWYNALAVRFTEHSNPLVFDIYTLDVYERQSDGSEVIIESYDISFDPFAVDDTGDSIFIESILETYSPQLRCMMMRANDEWSAGYELNFKIYDKDVSANVTVDLASAELTDPKQDFDDWTPSGVTVRDYMIIAKDGRGNTITGWVDSIGADDDTAIVCPSRFQADAATGWNGDTASFDVNSEITYIVKKSNTSLATAFVSADPVPLKRGSDGSLRNDDGSVDTTEAKNALAAGYAGTLTDPEDGSSVVDDVLDTDTIYFSLVFDCGYPSDVKNYISTLVQTRRDCVAIMDNGDSANFTEAIASRQDVNVYNTYFVALYEEYNKVFDVFTGGDVWFSPIYHMSYLLPRNDRVAELWWAAAGFNRAAIDTIKELRFNPRLGQRDQFYLSQLNPIVKFKEGYVVWGQLTSQAKASALQDLNIVRLILYIKRALEEFCKFFIFEMNDAITWGQVSTSVVEFLETIKKKRGLYAYSVEVGATEYEIKKKTFHVNVILQPTRVVEKIELNFFIK